MKKWFVELAGDGSLDSFVVEGDLENLIKVVNKEMGEDWSEEIIDADEIYTDMYGVITIELEQAYLRICPIIRKIK